jgi:hypothetical protein
MRFTFTPTCMVLDTLAEAEELISFDPHSLITDAFSVTAESVVADPVDARLNSLPVVPLRRSTDGGD